MFYPKSMHFVIMGSGRVGSTVATALDRQGHSVAIIDRDSTAFRALPSSFSGRKVKGIGFDRDTLLKAGIDKAFAFAAVSSGDNTNIIAARTARETFGVERVVARIYDPRRAEVYERLGIPTIGTVSWSASMILHNMLPDDTDALYRDAQTGVVILRSQPNEGWIGTSIRTLEQETGAKLAYIRRNSKPMFGIDAPLNIQQGDELFLCAAVGETERIRYALTHTPTHEH